MRRRPPAPRAPRETSAPPETSAPRAPRETLAPDDPRPARDVEVIYGLRAALAVFAVRPAEIAEVAYARAVRPDVEPLLRWAAGARVTCRELPDADLDRLAGAAHHEGICLAVAERRWTKGHDVADLLVRHAGTAIALDRVRNPYNVGAILRSAAFFGVDAALLGSPAPHPGLPPMAVRVAEGGAEHLAFARTTDLADTLIRLKSRGIHVVGADGAATSSAFGRPLPRPAVLVLGNEREGLGDRVRAACDAIVAIPGTGAVESLNVAVAAGVLIAELTRGGGAKKTTRTK